MRRFGRFSLTLLSVAVLLTSAVAPAAAGPEFRTRRVEAGALEDIVSGRGDNIALRYADDGTVIPLSFYYDGNLFAPVPEAYRDRPVEGCEVTPLQFTDETESSDWLLYSIKQLSSLGVMSGNDRGEAEPERELTRAEAAALLVRLLGIPQAEAGSPYADVPADAWFADVVSTAQALGIVMPDENFYPNRLVSKQEFTVMTARAFAAAGLLTIPAEVEPGVLDGYADAASVAEYALPAYQALGSCVISRTEGDTEEELRHYLDPQAAVQRESAAALLMECKWMIPVYPSKAAIAYGFDTAMPAVDGSTSTLPVTEAVYLKLFSNANRHPARPAGHSKTHASYERLIDGEVDLLFAGIAPGEDIYELAASKGVELELIPIGYDAMIFFTNAKNSITGLTSEQITEIYTEDAYDSWEGLGGPDALLYPYCRNEDSGSHANMERYFLKGRPIHPDIRNETTSVSMQNIFTDVVAAQTADPEGYGLGYSVYYYYQNTLTVLGLFDDAGNPLVKLLEIDGVAPTDESIADRSYPLSDNIYLVLRSDTPQDAPARKMAEFLLTEKGQECIEWAGFGTLK